MATDAFRKNLTLLVAAQSLLFSNNVLLIAINSLLGFQMVDDKRWASLPITTFVLGGALATLPAAFFMKRWGRRAGFMWGSAFGAVGALVSALAVMQASFWLLCLGTLLSGMYSAFGQQYRFAAAEVAPVAWKSRAISFTLAGGILGGVIGPQAGKWTRLLMEPAYLASYLTLFVFALLSMLIVSRLDVPALSISEISGKGRTLRQIARQPAFIVAVLAAASGFGVMNLLMTATPLAMDICGLPFSDTAFILQWHVMGMFVPSFFTGDLIKRFGVLNILLAGAALMLVCIAIALSGATLMHFWWALVLLGVGWNFLFIGGTTLLTETHRPEERAMVQGSNDFIVFGVQALTSLLAGLLVTSAGWSQLNLLALPIVVVTALASGTYWLKQRTVSRGALP